jgi:site-specific recombinase XerD
LVPFVPVYRSRLEEAGYTALTVVNELRQLARLSRWMVAAGLVPADLTTDRLNEFLEWRRATGGSGNCSGRALGVLRVVLHGAGVQLRDEVPLPMPADVLLASFRRYLLNERGLATGTAAAYVAYARRFLADFGSEAQLSTLSSLHVSVAVQRECARVSVSSAQYFVAGLRSFLRFCFVEGRVGTDLSPAALGVTGRRRSSLPNGITNAVVRALLGACDRRRPDGRRDYAILLTLVRLGLRAGEVARLALDDVDWRTGEIVVHGKGGRHDRLPLPVDVGEALVAYLRRGRPRVPARGLFLRTVAPIVPLGRGGVACVLRRACRRAGVPVIGPHRLRHTLACEMVAAGVELAQISEVLRHRSVASTAVYARVDIEALRELALPWPGGEVR